jgi:hypothetical protein
MLGNADGTPDGKSDGIMVLGLGKLGVGPLGTPGEMVGRVEGRGEVVGTAEGESLGEAVGETRSGPAKSSEKMLNMLSHERASAMKLYASLLQSVKPWTTPAYRVTSQVAFAASSAASSSVWLP